MIDERFSVSEFENLRGDRAARRSLAELLQTELGQELHATILPKVRDIIQRLNQLGHDLRPYLPDREEPGHIAYRDDIDDESGYDCKLSLAVDFTVSAGYADVMFSKSNPEGIPLYPED